MTTFGFGFILGVICGYILCALMVSGRDGDWS